MKTLSGFLDESEALEIYELAEFFFQQPSPWISFQGFLPVSHQ